MSTGKLRRANSLNINDTRIAGLYDLEHTIGKGHFAVVKLARHVFTGEKVAVKVIDKTRLDPVSTAHMMQEVRCMKLVQHPNIIRLYEIIDTKTKLFLILELGDYDMYDYIMKHDIDKAGGFKEQDAQQYFNQIIKAIDYCHTLHVVHRDLKPENVIFFEKLGMVKLTDFGFSNLFTPGERLETSCGSLAYSAPEILLGDAYDAPAVDVWSLGVILYMLVCGRLPFQEANESETLTKILDCKFAVPDYVSAPCKQLISRMLVRDPTKRATLDEVVQSAWVLAGDRGHAEALPLIERDHLPESAHTTIIEQMVAGGIGSEEEIIGAIEDDMYNYITATYYLLAERVLAAYRQEQASRLLNRVAVPSVVHSTCASIEETNESGDSASTSNSTGSSQPASGGGGSGSNVLSTRSRSNSWRGSTNARRACSILKEESEEELSSYLRSSSRQSSRFYNRGSGRAPSRAESLDSFMPEIHQIIPESLEDEDLCEALDDDESSDFPTDPADYLTLLAGRLDAVGRGGDFRTPPRNASASSAFRSPSLLSASGGSSNAIFFPPLRHNTRGTLRRSDASVEGTSPHPLSRLARSVDLGMMKPADFATSASPSIQIVKSGHDGTFPFDFATTAPSTPCSWNNELRGLLTGTALQDYNERKYGDGVEPPGKYYSSSTSGDSKRRSTSSYFYPATSATRTFANIPAALLTKNNKGRRTLPALSRRNSSPSVSMFGGVSVQSSTGIRSSREQVSPQAIQELLEFSRLSGKRAASPDSRISSRSSSPPCSSGRTSPAVTAIMSRLKAANLIPSTGGMRKLSSSPHLLGICEESEDSFFDNQNAHTSTGSSAGMINQNRSFISGSSASLKRRGNRSASIGFANARSSQRFSDVGSGGSDAVKSGIRGSTPRCIFSTSFEHNTSKPSTSSSQFFTPDRETGEDQVLGDLSPPKSSSIHLSSMDNSLRTGRLKNELSTSSDSSTHSLRGGSGGFTTTTIIDELAENLTTHTKLGRLGKSPVKKGDSAWNSLDHEAHDKAEGSADKSKPPSSTDPATFRP